MLTSINQISVSELIDIEKLLQKCSEHDGNSIPIYKHLIDKRHPIACNILYHENNQLIGYLRSFFFYADACEITLMVEPAHRRKKVATKLLKEILPIMREEGIKKLIFSTPPKINAKWFEKLGLKYRNSEYHMQYDLNNKSTMKPKPAKIRFAKYEDIPILCKIDEAAFPNKKVDPDTLFQSLLKTSNCDLFVLTLDGNVIGKAHIFTEPDKVRLTDIGILPEYRSQGFGSSLIKHCVNHALVRNKTNIALDVETTNEGALKLYQNLGFNITNTHDYWYTPIDCDNFGLNDIL
ncbi:MAG: GNAT family N-acetyltransferase [Legionellaceae bacterium]|nr:GNAT family N-acetyltransferase [Legionellaceae bacterium]